MGFGMSVGTTRTSMALPAPALIVASSLMR